MKILPVLSFVLLATISACWSKNLIVGTSDNARLVWQKKAEYMAIPFIKRAKEFFYANPRNLLIRGIIIRDLEHTDSTAIITAGGLDCPYVNIRLKSQRGESLNYQMEIYV